VSVEEAARLLAGEVIPKTEAALNDPEYFKKLKLMNANSWPFVAAFVIYGIAIICVLKFIC